MKQPIFIHGNIYKRTAIHEEYRGSGWGGISPSGKYPVYDALFDQHLISFENSGKIVLSRSLIESKYKEIGVTGKEIIKNFSQLNYPYLERHRESLIP